MFSNPRDIWDHLRSDIAYESYSDAKLAKLYLENVDDFPVHVFSKVLDVLLDPLFKLEDITFKSIGDIFTRISTYRRENLSSPNLDRQISSPSTSSGPKQLVLRPSSIPLDVVGLVIDEMVENRTPLGVASIEEDWRRAYSNDVTDFHSMSLVHPSWTPIVLRELRRRVIVPYHQLNSFLVSPLCGPWVTEAIIYWTDNNGTREISPSDVDLFEALLRRAPNIHSLAFNTSLVWVIYKLSWNKGEMPPLRVDACLELVSRLLPSLENLWLNHFVAHTHSTVSTTLDACREMRSLFELLPRMQSLKTLSLYRWAWDRREREVNLNEQPGSNLRTLELDDRVYLSSRALDWLVRPRNGFNLRSLSISIDQLQHIDYPLPNLKELRLYMPGDRKMVLPSTLQNYDQLVRLELFVPADLDLGGAVFPKYLEHIAFYVPYMDIDRPFFRSPQYFLPSWRPSSNFVPLIRSHLSYLACLRNLEIIGVPSVRDVWRANRNPSVEPVSDDFISGQLLDLCEEHGIKLSCGNV